MDSPLESPKMKEKISVLITTSLYHSINDGAISVIPILFPIFKDLFNLTYTQIGIISGGGLLITLFAQLMIGRKADGKNSKTLLSTGIVMMGASLLLLTQSVDFLSLLFFIFLIRLSASFFHPIGVGWVSRTFKKDKLDWAMGIQSGFGDVGAFIALSTTLLISNLTSWQVPLYIWAIMAVGGILIGTFISRNLDGSITSVQHKNKKQTIREEIDDAYLLLKNIKILIPAFVISGAAWGTTITYLPLLLQEKTILSLPLIGLLVAFWIGIGSIVSFFYGKISKYLGRKNALIFSYVTIGIMDVAIAFTDSVNIFIFILILLGISIFLSYPALFSFVSEITKENVEGKNFGVIFILQLGGGTVLLMTGGALSDAIGVWMPFILLGGFSSLFSLILLIFYKKPFVKNIST